MWRVRRVRKNFPAEVKDSDSSHIRSSVIDVAHRGHCFPCEIIVANQVGVSDRSIDMKKAGSDVD